MTDSVDVFLVVALFHECKRSDAEHDKKAHGVYSLFTKSRSLLISDWTRSGSGVVGS